MVRVDKQPQQDGGDEAFLLNTALAKRRVRVTQLLIIGLVGLLVGWLGNFFVSTSCNYVSSGVDVSQNGVDFRLHFGLWKYSPVDSALNGYKYCYPYDSSDEAPIFARIANLLALLAGTYSQVVLWYYLIMGREVPTRFWKWAVYSAVIAGVLQLATLTVFASSVCHNRHCTMGSGAILALVTAVSWFVFAFELHYNRPSEEQQHRGKGLSSMDLVELADLQGASKEYWGRLAGTYRPPPPLT